MSRFRLGMAEPVALKVTQLGSDCHRTLNRGRLVNAELDRPKDRIANKSGIQQARDRREDGRGVADWPAMVA